MYSKKPQGWKKHLDFILLDILCLQVAFVLAYITRHGLVSPYVNPDYREIAVVYTIVDMMVLLMNDTMCNVLGRGFYRELAQTGKHVALVELIIAFYLFSKKEGAILSRTTIIMLAVYYVVLSYSARLLWKQVLLHSKKSANRTAVYLISTSDRIHQVADRFARNTHNEYAVLGICLLDQSCVGERVGDIPVCADGETILQFLCDKWVDEVFISLPIQYEYPAELIDSLVEMGIVVHIQIEDSVDRGWQKEQIQKVAGSTVRTISITMATTQQIILKRTVDILGGIVGCILTAFLTLIIGPMIYIKSPGPIFFAQTRIGKNGKKFQMYKFRSMYPDAEARKAELMKDNRVKDGMMFKLDFDPRIIGSRKLPDGTIKKGIGNFIRDWSLDEFPQFFNVLRGDLSLVGTRPPLEDEWKKYNPHQRARLAIKPGITGLWQVSGRSNITDFEQVVELDKKYIREWSMGLDFRILLQTIKVVLGKDGAM